MLGAWSGATDGYDASYDSRITIDGSAGYAGVYHESDARSWSGPTGFYRSDIVAPFADDESRTWTPIHVWADPSYTEEAMYFAMEPNYVSPPPPGRAYTLELLYVPPGMGGAPAVGTTWLLPLDQEMRVKLPTYSTTDGLTGYQFAFTVHALPEPGTLAPLAVLGLVCRQARRGRLRR